jgi:hypothetical protein
MIEMMMFVKQGASRVESPFTGEKAMMFVACKMEQHKSSAPTNYGSS